MFDLSDKRALVTGATGGIGAAIARALHAQGAEVALSGSREEVLNQLAADLGARAQAVPCDLSDPQSVGDLPGRAAETMGGTEILVHCAGITRDNLAFRMKDAEWQDVIDVNLGAGFRLARASLRGMMKARWANSIYYIRGRRNRKSGAGQLRSFQVRFDGAGKGTRGRSREPRRDGELRSPGIYRDRHDRSAERRTARAHRRGHTGGAYWRGG